MEAVPVELGEGQVVLQRPALLALVRIVLPAAQIQQPARLIAIGKPDARADGHRPGVVLRFLISEVRIVEEAIARVLPAQVDACLVVDLGARKLGRVLIAQTLDLILLAHLCGQFQQMILGDRPVDLAEEQVFLERRTAHTQVRCELWCVVCGQALPQQDGLGRLELLAFVRHEEMHAIADDRAADGDTVLFLLRLGFLARFPFERIGCAPALVGVVVEHFRLELIGAGARHGHDRRAA